MAQNGYAKQPVYPPLFRGQTSVVPARAGLVPPPSGASATLTFLGSDGNWYTADDIIALSTGGVVTPGSPFTLLDGSGYLLINGDSFKMI